MKQEQVKLFIKQCRLQNIPPKVILGTLIKEAGLTKEASKWNWFKSLFGKGAPGIGKPRTMVNNTWEILKDNASKGGWFSKPHATTMKNVFNNTKLKTKMYQPGLKGLSQKAREWLFPVVGGGAALTGASVLGANEAYNTFENNELGQKLYREGVLKESPIDLSQVAANYQTQDSNNALAGTGAGALLGTLLGAGFSSPESRGIGTLAGLVGGGLLGSYVGGKYGNDIKGYLGDSYNSLSGYFS